MSKLYCEITESARRTTPTARAHDVGAVRVKNWKYAVETRMIDNGGGDLDKVRIVIRNLDTGEELYLANAMICDIVAEHTASPSV
jgi:hypothetical protein